MARTLLAEIVTPERIVYRNEVQLVVAPTIDGEIGILPLHIPLVTVLAPGEIRVRYGDNDDEVEWFAVSGGYLQVHEDKVIVLADAAVQASHVDVERAKRAKEFAQQRLEELKESGHQEQADECLGDMQWCEVQLKVAEKGR